MITGKIILNIYQEKEEYWYRIMSYGIIGMELEFGI